MDVFSGMPAQFLNKWLFMGMFLDMSLNTDTIDITPEILSFIAEIDEFKGAWRALGTLAPERLSALRRVVTIESTGSSTRIEGSRLTDGDVDRLGFQTTNSKKMFTVFQFWDVFEQRAGRCSS